MALFFVWRRYHCFGQNSHWPNSLDLMYFLFFIVLKILAFLVGVFRLARQLVAQELLKG